MNRLSVAAGSGRLSRSGRVVIFSLEPDEQLHALRPQPDGDIFKALATLIVARDFAVPSFAALDLEVSSLFLFGDIEIEVDGVVVSGATSATWTEQRYPAGSMVKAAGISASSVDTDLVEGCVPASAFALNLTVDEPLPGTCQSSDPKCAVAAKPVEAGEQDEFEGDETEEPSPGESSPGEAGSQQSSPGESSSGEAASEKSQPEEPQPEEPSSGATPTNRLPASSESSGRFRAPPAVTSLRPEESVSSSAPSVPEPPVASAKLTCSNGASVSVARGLLVGRFPSKHGVPDGYETFKVTGGEVSRVHLLFTVEAAALYVQDQKTSNGSTLISADRSIRSVPSGTGRLIMAPGDSVEFGDHTIRFDGWA